MSATISGKGKRTVDRLSAHVRALDALSKMMLSLAEDGNDRLTVNQATFFLVAAASDARGHPMTVTQIIEGSDGVINPSIANTYKVLLDTSYNKDYKNIGLGWLEREPDPDDIRRNYLRVTRKGVSVLMRILKEDSADFG